MTDTPDSLIEKLEAEQAQSYVRTPKIGGNNATDNGESMACKESDRAGTPPSDTQREISLDEEEKIKTIIFNLIGSEASNWLFSKRNALMNTIFATIRPYLRTTESVSLEKCAIALFGGEEHWMGKHTSDENREWCRVKAKAVLDAAKVKYVE